MSQSAAPDIKKGYLLLLITMLIWGSFTLMSRLGAKQDLTAWDITALRFATAFVVLMPIQLWRRELKFLLDKRILWLALLGGIGYSCAVYSGFSYAPAAHAAIWLNGFLPLATAISAWIVLKEPFGKNTWISLLFMAAGLSGMMAVMQYEGQFYLSIGDAFFVLGAALWGIYTVFLKRWMLPPWQAMAGVAIWTAIVYLPVYALFLPKKLAQASHMVMLEQGIFHGVFVVIIAMLTYIGAVERLGAFKTGSLLALAPFLAALAAVPLLNEPLNLAIGVGLLGMGIGALQPWRLWRQG
ncbi:DMT family transporter [Alkanindiges illinoisensis]|uniref:DMT family transporter n=1 Tax=Alkanindiges illinoisensis TaxID=197183 RepID=A0A4Y7XBX2_9GAMM|nr:DMT family transporter [Alkanindiges illinoisensis]TEU25023.1 DMT family transporter [Alkanindiges illinoisensis]